MYTSSGLGFQAQGVGGLDDLKDDVLKRSSLLQMMPERAGEVGSCGIKNVWKCENFHFFTGGGGQKCTIVKNGH